MKKKLSTTEFIRKRQAGSPEEGEVIDPNEEIASGFAGGREPGKAEEAFRALVEGSQGFLGLEPGRKGSEAYRTGQALSNLPALALPAAAIKGTGKASQMLEEIAKKAGIDNLITAEKSLLNLEDTNVSLQDAVKMRVAEQQRLINSMPFKYEPGQMVYTADTVKRNMPPLEIIGKRIETRIVKDPNDFMKSIKDPSTGRALRHPPEQSYFVTQRFPNGDISSFTISESAILGPLDEMAQGGEVSTTDFIRKREKGSPPEGEVPTDDYIQQMFTGTPPAERAPQRGLLPPELREAVDVPLDFLNTFIRGTAAVPIGSAYGLYQGITSDKFGTPEGVAQAGAEAGKMMSKITGVPKTQAARDTLEFLGSVAEEAKIPPMPQFLTTPAPGPGSARALMKSYELAETPPEGVIKLPGGNYLAGQVEKALNETKSLTAGAAGKSPEIVLQEMKSTYPPEVVKTLSPESVAQVNRAFADLEPKVALNKWIDSKLTKYVKNDMATERDPLRLQADKWATEQQPKLLAEKDAQIAKAQADMEKAQRERGVEPEVLTRSRARILELEKEREFIAARTGLHYTPPQTPELYRGGVNFARQSYGFPRTATATSEAGKLWEDLSDRFFMTRSYVDEVTSGNFFLRDTDAQRIMAENPWLSNVPPETQVQMLNRGISQQDTGFKHMTDELRNALNPNSGLPPSLQISTKDLEKMTVPQAADLVDRINAHRAVQKAEADKLAAQKSIEVYKEYPETEQGLRWVQIKLLDSASLPEGFSVSETKVPGTLAVRDANGKQVALGKNEDEAVRNFFKRNPDYLTKNLEEALKYEGDIMQHCVGGYCPDVISGESRIFSLRDSTGRPHATVEVAPDPIRTWDDVSNVVGPEEAARLWQEFDATSGSRIKKKDDAFLEFIEEKGLQTPAKIKQIKGKQNRKPEDEYIPFVQDFVKSQRWSSVGDINNTGLIDLRDTSRALDALGTRDLGELQRIKKVFKGDYLTPEELLQFRSSAGYAAGGEVTKFIKAHA